MAGNSSTAKPGGPLSGIRVLDMSRVLAGPSAGQMLGDFGAEVIKVERPGEGDQIRGFGSAVLNDRDGKPTRESAMHLSVNRNKQSITIDLSKPQGQDLVKQLAAKSDVFLENYVPGNLASFGLDYEAIRTVNPAIVYCSVSGFGQDGPYAHKAGYDSLFQAMSGWMQLTGNADGTPGGGPLKTGPNIVDMIVGLNATIGILVALRHRDQTGRGQHIDIALMDCAVAAIAPTAMQYLVGGVVPQRTGNHPLSGGPSTMLKCRDGAVFFIAGPQKQFEALCGILDLKHVATDSKFSAYASRWQHREELAALLQERAASWLHADFIAALDKAGIPVGPVNDLADVFADQHARHRGIVKNMSHPLADSVPVVANPIRLSDSPASYSASAPLLGEHNDQVLTRVLGMDAEAITRLRSDKII